MVTYFNYLTASRTRSLLDLRNVVQQPSHNIVPKPNNSIDENDGHIHDKADRASEAGDPIYYTIGSDKGFKPTPLMRNCVSLENLGGITIKSEMTTPEQHRKNALTMQQHPHSQNYNPAVTMKYQPPQMFQQQWPPAYPPMMHPHDYWRWSQFANQHGGFVPDARHFVHTTPNIGRSNTNSKQSLGSDDYRKYRDVAL